MLEFGEMEKQNKFPQTKSKIKTGIKNRAERGKGNKPAIK